MKHALAMICLWSLFDSFVSFSHGIRHSTQFDNLLKNDKSKYSINANFSSIVFAAESKGGSKSKGEPEDCRMETRRTAQKWHELNPRAVCWNIKLPLLQVLWDRSRNPLIYSPVFFIMAAVTVVKIKLMNTKLYFSITWAKSGFEQQKATTHTIVHCECIWHDSNGMPCKRSKSFERKKETNNRI